MIFRQIRRFLPIIALLAALAASQAVPTPVLASQAAPAITLKSVRVQIWPEYDKPSALVIYNVSLPATVTLPASLTLRIPAAAGKPNAVAWQAADKALYEINYETSAGGDWVQIKFSTPAPDFRIEYYDPSLTRNGAKRSFTFRWPGDYAVDNLTLEIQQPANATGMSFTPSAGPGQVSSTDGLTYYTLPAGKVNAGTTFELSMSYTKPDDTLTSPSQYQPVTPNQPVSTANGRVSIDQLLPWILGGIGLLLIAAGLFWYYYGPGRGRKGARPQDRPRHARASGSTGPTGSPGAAGSSRAGSSSAGSSSAGSSGAAAAAAATPAREGDIIFCTQCGKRAAPGDVFCRACGARLVK